MLTDIVALSAPCPCGDVSSPLLLSAGMGANTEVLPLAVSYLRCRALATPAALMMYVATGSFRGFKDTK